MTIRSLYICETAGLLLYLELFIVKSSIISYGNDFEKKSEITCHGGPLWGNMLIL